MKLKKGDLAPEFETIDILENLIDLKSRKGKKIFLSFYRGASCPFCNLRVHELTKQMTFYEEKGLIVIGFFMSDKQEILSYMEKHKPPFTIVADPSKKIYDLYSLEKSVLGKLRAMFRLNIMMKIFSNGFFNLKSLKDDNTLPGDFLINENGIIEQAYYGRDFGDHIDFEVVRVWILS